MPIEQNVYYEPQRRLTDVPRGAKDAKVMQLFPAREQRGENSLAHEPLPVLTDWEFQILLYNAQGYKTKDFSRGLNTHRGINQKSIYKKYGVDNATQAVSLAVKHNVLTDDILDSQFDYSQIEDLSEKHIKVLQELTNTEEENTNAAIGQRLGMPPSIVNGILQEVYGGFSLYTRPQAAAFYLMAAKHGLIEGDTTTFVDDGHAPRAVEKLPEPPKPWRSPYSRRR